ncbi:MAG: proline dehydrogenase family protein [Acidobacteriota bacterium]|nr:proline dehydrogenase family protein [Acidobacteriota bacterium]MDH3523721.1 proline dehydrogenase family protein [Acidobacteriota bacterium]
MSLLSRLVMASVPIVPRALVGRVARRYVAGETHEEAIALVRELNALGALATIGPLGEEATERSRAAAAVDEHLELIAAIHASGVDANVSLKPTLLGLQIDADFCRDNVERIVAAAREKGNFVRLDMEDRTCTDATLALYRDLQPRYGNLGVVLQAYMRRTLDDIAALAAPDLNVRLCKGIYIEPRATAWKGRDTVRRNFVAALDKLLAAGAYVGIATHDELLVCEACALVERYALERSAYEFQMLLGVDEELRDVLIARGHRLRVYVPYGRDWYQYSIRRLRENPEVAGHVVRATLGVR